MLQVKAKIRPGENISVFFLSDNRIINRIIIIDINPAALMLLAINYFRNIFVRV